MAQWITIIGGAHSGKTKFVHEVCASLEDVVWWGTASELPQDADWQQHLESLRSSRKSSWLTLEGPWSWPPPQGESLQDSQILKAKVFVLDSLNLWLAAQINRCTSLYSLSQMKVHLELEFERLLENLRALSCPILLVSAEAGSGVVPAGEAGRLFRDLLGQWNCAVVKESHHGISMQAGRALFWPGGLTELPPEGVPVRCVDARLIQRVLCQV